MSKAIVTKYIGATNSRGARISVKAEGLPRMYVHWDDALHIDANHTQAAKQFAAKHGWAGQWCGGGMPDQTGNAYVRISPDIKAALLAHYPNGKADDESNFYIPYQT